MSEQDDEEEKLRWRVEAEVKLALQEAQAAQSQQGLTDQGVHQALLRAFACECTNTRRACCPWSVTIHVACQIC